MTSTSASISRLIKTLKLNINTFTKSHYSEQLASTGSYSPKSLSSSWIIIFKIYAGDFSSNPETQQLCSRRAANKIPSSCQARRKQLCHHRELQDITQAVLEDSDQLILVIEPSLFNAEFLTRVAQEKQIPTVSPREVLFWCQSNTRPSGEEL